ncbi:ketoacyl-ACP synthase III [bacterium]|nr:ketoacyl-ACP synthase III [bacterium]
MTDQSSPSPYYRSKIAGTGSYLPEKTLTNKDLEKLVDTSDEWILERTGISTRHLVEEGQYTSDLALVASNMALKEAGLKAQDIDMILVATVSGDYIMPTTACVLQTKLGATDCMALDISAACSGFIYGLSIADQFIKTGQYKNVLIVGAEVLHNLVDYTDRNTCILFGDGAGACVLTRAEESEDSQIYSTHLHADGKISHLFELLGGGSAYPTSQETLDKGLHHLQMNGREIFKHAVRTMSKCCDEALAANKMSPEEVNWVIPHQANVRIMEAVAKHFGISMDKVINEIQHMGNISAATVIVAMDRAIRDGRIQRGQNLLLTAFGAGITSGSALLKY